MLSKNKREALAKVKDALEFQIAVCDATNTSSGVISVVHAIFLCHIIEELLDNGGKL